MGRGVASAGTGRAQQQDEFEARLAHEPMAWPPGSLGDVAAAPRGSRRGGPRARWRPLPLAAAPLDGLRRGCSSVCCSSAAFLGPPAFLRPFAGGLGGLGGLECPGALDGRFRWAPVVLRRGHLERAPAQFAHHEEQASSEERLGVGRVTHQRQRLLRGLARIVETAAAAC